MLRGLAWFALALTTSSSVPYQHGTPGHYWAGRGLAQSMVDDFKMLHIEPLGTAWLNGAKTLKEATRAVKKAFRQLSRVYHPDRPGGDEEMQKQILAVKERLLERIEQMMPSSEPPPKSPPRSPPQAPKPEKPSGGNDDNFELNRLRWRLEQAEQRAEAAEQRAEAAEARARTLKAQLAEVDDEAFEVIEEEEAKRTAAEKRASELAERLKEAEKRNLDLEAQIKKYTTSSLSTKLRQRREKRAAAAEAAKAEAAAGDFVRRATP